MIKTVQKATDQQWDAFVDAVPTATYFQTREWFQVWAEYAGFENETLLFCLGTGKRVLLPLACLRLLRGILPVYFLTPKGMGGFVAHDELEPREQIELYAYLKRWKLSNFVLNHFDALSNGFDAASRVDHTHVVHLAEGYDALLRKWSQGHLRSLKKGLNERITVCEATSESDWKAYYAVYQDSVARWGTRATNDYTWKLFDILRSKKSGRIKLWVARYQDEIISGALCLYQHKYAIYWGGGTLQRHLKLNAPFVVQDHIIRDACERGYDAYDMLQSGGHEGVVRFKKGFGAEEVPLQIYQSPFMRIIDAHRETIRKMPLYRFLLKGRGV